jgi:hypothetical protein
VLPSLAHVITTSLPFSPGASLGYIQALKLWIIIQSIYKLYYPYWPMFFATLLSFSPGASSVWIQTLDHYSIIVLCCHNWPMFLLLFAIFTRYQQSLDSNPQTLDH